MKLRAHFEEEGEGGSKSRARVLAVKTGKRPRFTEMDAGTEARLAKKRVVEFVDSVLGGGAKFKKLETLPSL